MILELICSAIGILSLSFVYWLFDRHGWKIWETLLLLLSVFVYAHLQF